MAELLIKRDIESTFVDAYSTYGIRMGDGFLNSLLAPLPLKEQIEYSPRTKNGKVVVRGERRFDSREVNLTFRIIADSKEELEQKRKNFYDLLYNEWIDIKVSDYPDIYHLRYTGKNATFGINLARTSFYITAKFEEIDPTNR